MEIKPKHLQHLNRRKLLQASAGMLGFSLPGWLSLREQLQAAPPVKAAAKSCIVVYCWGGMSHHETFDPKPDAPLDVRGPFGTIPTATVGLRVGENIPRLARRTEKIAIVRSIHHDQSAHGRGMYWNMTGHAPPPVPAGNIAPTREHWPSLAAMISTFHSHAKGVPNAVRLPHPLVDNGTLQAGEYGGWLGMEYDPIVMKTPSGKAWGGVSRSLGAEVLDLGKNIDRQRLGARTSLRRQLERRLSPSDDFGAFPHFRELATDMLLSSGVRTAYDLEKEKPQVRAAYGDHIGGQSLLLARRLIEAGVPVVQVCCSAGDLNGGSGDMWDTHSDNFNRLKKRLLPVYDQGMSALLDDLEQRGMLDETLVVFLTEFGRTPKINKSAGRDHYPNVYSVALAGAGVKGGQVYGSSDSNGAYPRTNPCSPADFHATIFQTLGISPRSELRDPLGRPFQISNGKPLPLL